MRITTLSLTISLMLTPAAFAEGQLPVEVVHPEKLAEHNPVSQVGGIISNSMTPGASAPLPVNMPEEQQLLLKMQQAAEANMPAGQLVDTGNLNDQLAEKVKSKYAPTQDLTVRPSGNVMVPVSLGLMNRIETNFHNVSVKTSDESAVLEVDGGVLYVTPPALVRVRIPMSSSMMQDAFDYQRKAKDAEMVEKAMSEEEEIVRSDRHTERIKEILKYTALGQVPAGFTLADNLDEVPNAYRKPCRFDNLVNVLGQRMVGAREFVDVVLVTNKSTMEAVIKEEFCMSRDTLAVGVMDAATLRPGASTEVYVVRDKNWSKKQSQLQTRPRLDNNGSFGLNGYQRVAGSAPTAPSKSGLK